LNLLFLLFFTLVIIIIIIIIIITATYPNIYWPIFYIWQRQFVDDQTTLYTLFIVAENCVNSKGNVKRK